MAMGKKGEQQDELFVPYSQMPSAGHPFYRALDSVVRELVVGLEQRHHLDRSRRSGAPGRAHNAGDRFPS